MRVVYSTELEKGVTIKLDGEDVLIVGTKEPLIEIKKVVSL